MSKSPSLQPRKRFAQHWLCSDKALNRIVQAAELTERDRVLEIGPGKGALTRLLLPRVSAVVAVEIDRDLCKHLVQKLGKVDNFLLLAGDILTLDLAAHLTAFPKFQAPNKVVANIPYHITGPILDLLLGTLEFPAANSFEQIVLLVQKEVADRMCARPGSKTFGALSVRLQYLATCERICDVPAKAFYPPPKVDSAVVRIRPHQAWSIPKQQSNTEGTSSPPAALNPKLLDTLVKSGFSNKRKMLRNNLKALVNRDLLTHFLEKLDIVPHARAEDLSVAQWVALSNQLSTIHNGERGTGNGEQDI